jgi:hypothetical protein
VLIGVSDIGVIVAGGRGRRLIRRLTLGTALGSWLVGVVLGRRVALLGLGSWLILHAQAIPGLGVGKRPTADVRPGPERVADAHGSPANRA